MESNSFQTLKRQIDFSKVRSSGKKFKICRWLAVTLLLAETDQELIENSQASSQGSARFGSRFGFVISKKVGSAVLRNRLRRWSKESLRKIMADLPSADYVLVFYGLPVDEMKMITYEKVHFQLSKLPGLATQKNSARYPSKKPAEGFSQNVRAKLK